MAKTTCEIRSGAYYDSVVLMQLQRSLAEQDGVLDAGVVMGTDANKDVLAQSDLLAPEARSAGADDMVIVVRAESQTAARSALEKVDELLSARSKGEIEADYRPKSLETASRMLPEAQWVLVSVPGRYAAGVARQALDLGKHVFLYSDNVALEDEIKLKQSASRKGLLVMGPDCGTAIVNGIGLGFANKVRQGSIGMVAAAGTGLQQVSVRIHQFGAGISHALGTGGRDLSEDVNAITARQGIDLLNRDPNTRVIVLVSKPPSAGVADDLVEAARRVSKPVVVDFIGYATQIHQVDNITFTTTFDETAREAVRLAEMPGVQGNGKDFNIENFAPSQRYLRGLFSGGTLAYEALLVLQDYIPAAYSNAPLDKKYRLEDSLVSQENTIIDLGEDEFTVGRLHPMMDNDLRIRRLETEANDPEVAVILLDVVLGYGAHPDPASELAPAIKKAIATARQAGRRLEVMAVVSGTDEDPQGMQVQIEELEKAGAKVETSNDSAARDAGRLVRALIQTTSQPVEQDLKMVDPAILNQPLAAINVGLESFTESLQAQGAKVIQMDWRPPAGGDQKMMDILERLKIKS